MKFKEYRPSAILQPFVRSYRLIESADGDTNRVLPGTSFALAFRLRGQVSYLADDHSEKLPAVAFSGLRRSVRLIRYAPRTSVLVVLFTETGVSAFFRGALHELFEQSVELGNFLPSSEVAMIEEQLAACNRTGLQIAVIEKFLMSHLQSSGPDALVTEALRCISREKGDVKIRSLAGQLYISQDAFEKRFRKVVGTTPKKYAGIVKMRTVIRQIPTSGFLDVALDNGYFDQAHFNRDFKRFTGLSPTEFSRPVAFW